MKYLAPPRDCRTMFAQPREVPAPTAARVRIVRTSMSREPGKRRQRARMVDDPLYLFGRLLRIREMREMEKKYGANRRGNVIRIAGTTRGEVVHRDCG